MKLEKPESSKKTKAYLLVLLVGVALTVWGMFFKDRSFSEVADDFKKQAEESTDEDDDSVMVTGVNGSYLEGYLENSDDLVQGNYKLMSDLSRIYIKTSRDFDSLVGSDVLVSIDGTMENFTLLDIQKRVEKDGYIQPQ